MISGVKKGLNGVLDVLYSTEKDKNKVKEEVKNALNYFFNWDYKYDLDKIAPTIYLGWEYWIASYF